MAYAHVRGGGDLGKPWHDAGKMLTKRNTFTDFIAAVEHLTAAGYWLAFVSIPLFQFILFRWYMRLVLWFRLLWQISRLNLHLTAAHPDREGGIGFLG